MVFGGVVVGREKIRAADEADQGSRLFKAWTASVKGVECVGKVSSFDRRGGSED